ncbi:hypothetical protein PUNSTDRAFT_127845 [Punctularia strigosozonata HHB-11173 SS5]|uniref:uncharacterized protein n=1 Tax=Punctularia strigosozonata (strain HHB-11173) TaxID=741275 RepID=UPI000441755A|nr:uncharacterized protein PUNSTDRAFT_127845 [Punctularia strigosozonata HHB-11173 SS5]EIN05384.1 hypothetical protein PUNSTDRAFT_127845 [Punctularia strigosozonata HHB-11173 SS5]
MIRARLSRDPRARSPSPLPPAQDPSTQQAQPFSIPTICLTTATPNTSAVSDSSLVAPFANAPPVPPLPLAPRAEDAPKRRLVPKKSKLSLLANVGAKKDKSRDLSDVVRRVGADVQGSASARGGFEIYVDPTDDPDMGEIVMIKRQKSRRALNGMMWGNDGALGEVTNVPKASKEKGKEKEKENKPATATEKLKPGDSGSQKWWSIGRGRKDSKEKGSENEKEKTKEKKAKRSKTPDALASLGRPRFASLDSGVVLNSPAAQEPSMEQLFGLPPRPAPTVVQPTRGSTPATVMMAGTTPRSFLAPPMSRADSSPTPPPASTFLAPPGMARSESTGATGATNASNSGSIAIRAMRSMRSLAHIGSWAQLKNGEGEVKKGGKKKERKEGKAQAARNASQATTSSFEAGALSMCGGSPEVTRRMGTVSSIPEEGPKVEKKKSVLGLGIGLGWPSTMRMTTSPVAEAGTVRLVNQERKPSEQQTNSNRLSVDSYPHAANRNSQASGVSGFFTTRGRAGSRSTVSSQSTAESLRPMSTSSYSSGSGHSSRPVSAVSGVSGNSGRPSSCVSSASSVRWDEERLETVREGREREKKTRPKGARAAGSKRASGEGRKRTSLADVFPGVRAPSSIGEEQAEDSDADDDDERRYPMVMVESATSDSHSGVLSAEEDEEGGRVVKLETPQKQRRARPVSEHMLGKPRPVGIHDDVEGVKSILDQATDDLALLVDNLEATPGTPDLSPYRASPGTGASREAPESPTAAVALKNKWKGEQDSPVKRPTTKTSLASITSLRPYAQSRSKASSKPIGPTATISASNGHQLGMQIAPWPVSPPKLKPVASSIHSNARPRPITETPPGWRPTHRRTLSPPGPAIEPPPVFKALSPPITLTSRKPSLEVPADSSPPRVHATPPTTGHRHTPSSLTFGKANSKVGNRLDLGDDAAEPSPTPVFRKAAHGRPRSTEIPPEQQSPKDTNGMPLAPEAKRGLGLGGTMGGSVASGMTTKEVDPEDPDSDIPDELQVILSGQSDEEMTSFGETLTRQLQNAPQRLPSPGLPPQLPLPIPEAGGESPPTLQVPIFEALVTGPNGSCPSSPASTSEDDTKKSFDFTGELKKLNESGASDRRSFVEQLESAFRTPSKVDLTHFGDFLAVTDVPPVPKLPDFVTQAEAYPETESSDSSAGVHSAVHVDSTSSEDSSVDQSAVFSELEGLVVEAELPNPLPSMEMTRSQSSLRSRPSDGQLDVNFKFGGMSSGSSPSSIPEKPSRPDRPLTLSDIIPPPSHVRALSTSVIEEDSEVLKSIFAKAAEVDAADSRLRVDSTTSSKRRARDMAMASLTGAAAGHKRGTSEISFAGLDSFEEVRRGFEFGPNRPAFYAPQGARATKRTHGRETSLFSIASISSYGKVINPGVKDPFGFTMPGMPSRPPSMDMSISMSTLDDTFSFLKQDPERKRVDSDASSFYFRASSQASHRMSIVARGHRRDDSAYSVGSVAAPPISMFNRSFGHRRDNSGSSSSVALSYAIHGANGGRAAWARHHRQEASVDSIRSHFSAARLGRPGLGDKMLESAPMDYGQPLHSISASPTGSVRDFTADSAAYISSYDSIMDDERKTTSEDSIFDKTDLRASTSDRKTAEDSIFDKASKRSSTSGESLFHANNAEVPHLLPAWRPVSVLSYGSSRSPPEDDDTMVTMLGGGHVRRQSIGSVYEGSPCVQVEKRVNILAPRRRQAQSEQSAYEPYPKPSAAKEKALVQQPSIASTSSYQFGDQRMVRATHGLLERQSLESSCLSAEGEDSSSSFYGEASFKRPKPGNRSRSNTYASSGADTPPLSSSDGSSEGGSMSSIDMSHLSIVLANVTHPLGGVTATRARTRARGRGHRRRISEARMSRSSVYETIPEEANTPSAPRLATVPSSEAPSPAISRLEDSVIIVDSSFRDSAEFDEQDYTVLRRYYALRNEAHETLEESKRVWSDTPFSVFAVQTFDPPSEPEGMKALLHHSQQAYGPLPHELRLQRARSRKNSRPSPYPSTGIQRSSPSDQISVSPGMVDVTRLLASANKSTVLRQVPRNENTASPRSALKLNAAAKATKAFAAYIDVDPVQSENVSQDGLPQSRPRVNSAARRTALGWSKRSTGKNDQKENDLSQQSVVMNAPGSLRINRPRPRGRPTPARTAQPQTIRI